MPTDEVGLDELIVARQYSACDALVEAVKARSDGGEPNDDVSVVVVTMRPAME